jgi:hypothetical protein
MPLAAIFPEPAERENFDKWGDISCWKAEKTVRAFIEIPDEAVREGDIYELQDVEALSRRGRVEIPIDLVVKIQRLQHNPNLTPLTRSFLRNVYRDFARQLEGRQEAEGQVQENPAYRRYKKMENDLLKGEHKGQYVLIVGDKEPIFREDPRELSDIAEMDKDSTLENTILRKVAPDTPCNEVWQF